MTPTSHGSLPTQPTETRSAATGLALVSGSQGVTTSAPFNHFEAALPRDTQLREDAHPYRETNGVQIMATLRSVAM